MSLELFLLIPSSYLAAYPSINCLTDPISSCFSSWGDAHADKNLLKVFNSSYPTGMLLFGQVFKSICLCLTPGEMPDSESLSWCLSFIQICDPDSVFVRVKHAFGHSLGAFELFMLASSLFELILAQESLWN